MRQLLLIIAVSFIILGRVVAQDIPSLVGPILYAQPLRGNVLFYDVSTDEVWEVEGESLIENGMLLSWSPNGCFALFGNRNVQEYALINVQNRSIDYLDLARDDEYTLAGVPQWSPASSQLAYSLFDGSDSNFYAYDYLTEKTELLYGREDFGGIPAYLTAWTSDTSLRYTVYGYEFEVNLTSGELEFLLRGNFVNLPISEPFTRILRSPDNRQIASFFDLPEFSRILDYRYSLNNTTELEAMEEAIVEYSGISIYIAETDETLNFELDGQVVSAATWSPDSSYLAIQTFPENGETTKPGAYIYDTTSNSILVLDELYPVRHTDSIGYGFFQPSWSSNEEWLTLFGYEQGWIVYNLAEETIQELPSQFQEPISIMSVGFSPVMAYSPDACE